MCLECGVKPCKRGAKKYCSKECSLKNTAVQKQFFNKKEMYAKRKTWNKGVSYSKELKLRLDMSGLEKGRGYFKGKKRLDITGINSTSWVKPITKKCSYCSKTLRLKPNQVKNRTKNFCNRACWALGTRDKGSPVYKGEKAVSRLRGRVACMPEYKQWHALILNRDNYKCVLCQSKKDLEVDHIKRFLFIANENSIITLEDARKCKELWDTDNGQTVCKICHRTLNTYGTKGLRKNLST